MHADRLVKLGFDLSSGFVYRNNKAWGTFNASGEAALTPDGEDLVAQLEAGDDPAAPAAPVEMKPRAAAKKAAKKAPVQDELPLEAAPDAPAQTPEAAGLEADLAGLGSLLDE